MKTLAYVIGNDEYKGSTKLENAVNDAKAIGESFENLGYEVKLELNMGFTDISRVLGEYQELVNDYDASIFYFAGHGFEFKGRNYLASVDCPMEFLNEYECNRQCITLEEIMDIIKNSNTHVNIVIIDACRKALGRSGVSHSFTPVSAPEGTIIAFSTSPGEAAKDGGMDGHSIYTGTLLKYIGREFLSVEDLFKKVRKSIYNLTKGTQTSWEHTSLIGDFYFNTGQLVHSVDIPYDENVVKDKNYQFKGLEIDNIIMDLASSNWNKQNPAMVAFNRKYPSDFNKNELFLIGRNIYQSSDYANNATSFIESLSKNLDAYFDGDENHLLNGMLFEIYFNNNGEFRHHNIKKNSLDEVFLLRHNEKYKASFKFIANVLERYKSELFFIPFDGNESIVDVDIFVEEKFREAMFGKEKIKSEVIQSIKIGDKDIVKDFSRFCTIGLNIDGLKKSLSEYLVVPLELININSNLEIKRLDFDYSDEDEVDPW